MSISTIVIGLVLGLIVAGVIWWLRGRRADAMSVLLVVGIAGLAVAVTVLRVQQYRDQQAQTAAATQDLAANAPTASAGPPPRTNGPPREPVNLPVLPPTMHPPTGSAAPPAAQNPYSGG